MRMTFLQRGGALLAALVLGLTACRGDDDSAADTVGRSLLPPLAGPVTVANVEQVAQLATLEGFPGAIRALAFDADGSLLAAGDDQGVIRLWDLGNGALLDTLAATESPVARVAFNPDDATLSAWHDDGALRIWDLADAEAVAVLDAPPDDLPGDVALSPAEAIEALAGPGAGVTLREPGAEAALAVLTGHDGPATVVAFRPDGWLLASGGADATVRLWGVPVAADAVELVFGEDEVNALVAESLAELPEISAATVDLDPAGYGRVTFTASVFGAEADGTARVRLSHDGAALALALYDVTLLGLPAPDAIVQDANDGLATIATPRLNALVAERAGGPYTVAAITISEAAVVVAVRPAG